MPVHLRPLLKETQQAQHHLRMIPWLLVMSHLVLLTLLQLKALMLLHLQQRSIQARNLPHRLRKRWLLPWPVTSMSHQRGTRMKRRRSKKRRSRRSTDHLHRDREGAEGTRSTTRNPKRAKGEGEAAHPRPALPDTTTKGERGAAHPAPRVRWQSMWSGSSGNRWAKALACRLERFYCVGFSSSVEHIFTHDWTIQK